MAKSREADAPVEAPRPEGVSANWREVEDREITKWADVPVGVVVEGVLLEIREAGQGKVVDLAIGGGETVTYGCPRVLERKLTGLVGYKIGLVCLGKVLETDNGLAWNFRVFVGPKA